MFTKRVLEITDPRQGILTSYKRPVLYNIFLYKESRLIRFKKD